MILSTRNYNERITKKVDPYMYVGGAHLLCQHPPLTTNGTICLIGEARLYCMSAMSRLCPNDQSFDVIGCTNLLHRQTGGHTVVVRPFFVLLDRCTNFKIITQFMAMRWNEKEHTNNRSKGNYLIFCDSRTSVSTPKWTAASAV